MPDGMTAPLYLDTGEPDAATSCTSGSEGGGWKSAQRATRWPPTLLDAVVFLDLPGRDEKRAIWDLYLDQFQLNASQPLPNDEQFTGAEIRACCRLAALLDVPLQEAATNVIPVATTAAESVQRLRKWASGRCLSADQPGIYQAEKVGKSRRKIPRDVSAN